MLVRELAAAGRVVTVRDTDDLALANQMMIWSGVKHLPVMHGGALVGVLSATDIFQVRGRAPHDGMKRAVKSAMSQPALTIGPDADVTEAAARMVERDIGCLPVIDHGALVGILTRADLLAQEAVRGYGPVPLRDPGVHSAMREAPVTVREDDDLLEAAQRMQNGGFRHLPVIDGERRVVGVLSDQDIRAATGASWLQSPADVPFEERVHRLKVSHAMSTPAVTVPESASMALAARYFMDHRVSALPVVDGDDRLVGIVSYLDMLAAAYKTAGYLPPAPPA
jgi:CBS domain-containing protein